MNSRRKEVERLAPNDLARSNIQRPYIKFDQAKPGGRHALEFEGVRKGYDLRTAAAGGDPRLHRHVQRGEKIALMGRNGAASPP